MNPDTNSRKANQGKKSGSEFFITGSHRSLFLDALEEVFDMVAFFVESFVKSCRRFSIRLGRDAGLQAQPVQGPAELVRVVSFVGEDSSLSETLHQIRCGGQIVTLSSGQAQSNRLPTTFLSPVHQAFRESCPRLLLRTTVSSGCK